MAVRIEPVDDGQVSESVRHHFELAERRGAPNATLLRILARDPRSLDVFYDAWNAIFYEGSLDHGLKEIVRAHGATAGLRLLKHGSLCCGTADGR